MGPYHIFTNHKSEQNTVDNQGKNDDKFWYGVVNYWKHLFMELAMQLKLWDILPDRLGIQSEVQAVPL